MKRSESGAFCARVAASSPRHRQELRGRYDLVDQSHPVRLVGADLARGHGDVERVAGADQPRHPHHRAVGRDHAEPRHRPHHEGVVGHDAQVAGEREGGPGAVRRAVDRRDHRLDAALQRVVEAVVLALVVLGDVFRRVDRRIGEIGAGAEHRAGAGEDADAQVAIAAESVECLEQARSRAPGSRCCAAPDD